jgi:hypothetical protein
MKRLRSIDKLYLTTAVAILVLWAVLLTLLF